MDQVPATVAGTPIEASPAAGTPSAASTAAASPQAAVAAQAKMEEEMEVSAPQEIADEEMLVCCSCHRHTLPKSAIVVVRAKTKTSKDVCRCRKCHNLRARCDRVVVSRGALVEDWSSVTEEEKRQFYVDAEDKCGHELLLKMQETITHSTMKRSTVKFTGTGDFMDEIDLDNKYANKLDQLANIKKHTRGLCCARSGGSNSSRI